MSGIKLDAALIEGFAGTFLSPGYDNPKPTPQFHREVWEMCASDEQYIAVAAPRGHAKAQSVDSKVLTPDGWVRLGDIRRGDKVIGRGGRPVTVRRAFRVSRMRMFRVTTRDGRTAVCNIGHVWEVECPSNRKGKIQQKTLDEIMTNWKVDRYDKRTGKTFTEYRYRIHPETVRFEERDLPIDPYTLGAWLGDGHSASGRITSADPEILAYMPYPTKKYSKKYLYGVEGLTTKLRELGVLQDKYIPEEYLRASVDQRLRLLQGLMDTDGTVHRDGRIAYLGSSRKRLVEGAVALIRSLGGCATVSGGWTTCGEKRFYAWRVSCKLPKGMNPFRLKRKAEKWAGSTTVASYIVAIEPLEEMYGRCIQVEGGTYFTDDYLMTHNSTCVTHDYIMAAVMFRVRDHVLIVSDTEGQAAQFLGDIKVELEENQALREQFGVGRMLKDSERELVCEMNDGYQFRIVAKGSEQKVRGLKWRGKRPNLVVGDDLENDEIVMNRDRREKFRNWFFNALLPCGGDDCLFRIVGTILHLDSLLQRLMDDDAWTTKLFAAHNRDFSEILWPEKFSRKRLEAIRQRFINQGMPDGYAQEYLNTPLDEENMYFRREDFIPIPDGFDGPYNYYIGGDFAISQKKRADMTSFTVGGITSDEWLDIVDNRKGRWDADEIIREMIALHRAYTNAQGVPPVFLLEQGAILKAIGPSLERAMAEQRVYLNMELFVPVADKQARARSFQARHRARKVRFRKDADWYPGYEDTLLKFPRGKHEDDVDSTALIGLGLDKMIEAPYSDEIAEEEYEDFLMESGAGDTGRNPVTGY